MILFYGLIIIGIGAIIYFRDNASQTNTNTVTNERSPIVTPTVPPAVREDVIIEQPTANEAVSSPLALRGRARGTWYFEASFPVYLVDANGQELAVAVAQAEGEWMTTEYVPFSATMTIPAEYHGAATLIFKKDNPSGLPEHDRQISLPIIVK